MTTERRHREATVKLLLNGAVMTRKELLWLDDPSVPVSALWGRVAAALAKAEADAVAPWEALMRHASATTTAIEPSFHGEKAGWSIDLMDGTTLMGSGSGGAPLDAARALCEQLVIKIGGGA